jgi:hypothetical protein
MKIIKGIYILLLMVFLAPITAQAFLEDVDGMLVSQRVGQGYHKVSGCIYEYQLQNKNKDTFNLFIFSG